MTDIDNKATSTFVNHMTPQILVNTCLHSLCTKVGEIVSTGYWSTSLWYLGRPPKGRAHDALVGLLPKLDWKHLPRFMMIGQSVNELWPFSFQALPLAKLFDWWRDWFDWCFLPIYKRILWISSAVLQPNLVFSVVLIQKLGFTLLF